jgi:hypothetical protein
MTKLIIALFLTTVAGSSAAEVQAQVTPVQKVIQMLNDMMAKGKAEKEDEQVRFATFTQFCKSTTTEKNQAIETTSAEIDDLTADIASYGEEIMTKEKEIAQHDDDIGAWTKEKEEATYAREKEHADFVVEHQDYTASIDSVERAIETVESGNKDVSLLQQKSALSSVASMAKVPAAAKKVIMSFVQSGSDHDRLEADLLEISAPQGKVFESHSSGILDMVKGMGDKMEEKREEIEKEEMNKKHSYDMIAQDLVDQIESNEQARSKKASIKAQAAESKAQAEGDLAAAKNLLAEDQKFLSDLTQECEQKSADFDKRQEVRQGEIEAIQKAIEIMSSSDIASGTQHLPGLVQTSPSFAQLRSSSSAFAQKSVADFLSSRATALNSRLLSLLATRAQDDPFKKVTKMIKDMIQKLMQEATEEAEHKGFCDTELTTNKQTRDAKTEESDELTAESEKLTADIQKLASEIATLGEEIAALDSMMAKATSIREAEKEKNKATIEDAKGAQAATQQALTVLKEFYDKAAVQGAAAIQEQVNPQGPINYDERALQILDKTSLLQRSSSTQKPEMEEGGYTGMGNGGVMGMLEVIESDFARLLAETTADEAESAAEYEKLSNDTAEDKAVKETDSKSKTGEKTRKESALSAAQKDLASTKEELKAAMDYYEKLKPSCVDAGISYEERVAKRKEEIESLQEALKILSADAA